MPSLKPRINDMKTSSQTIADQLLCPKCEEALSSPHYEAISSQACQVTYSCPSFGAVFAFTFSRTTRLVELHITNTHEPRPQQATVT